MGEGQQTHHWNWVLGTMVPVSETVHRATGFDWALEEHVLRTGVDPKLLQLLDTDKVSVGRLLAYLLHTQHGLPVLKDPHSVQASVKTGGSFSTLPERAIIAHIMKAKEMKAKEETGGGTAPSTMSAKPMPGRKYTNDEQRELRGSLARLLPNASDGRRMWKAAAPGYANDPDFDGPPVTMWFRILEEADNHNIINVIIWLATQEFSSDAILQKYLRTI